MIFALSILSSLCLSLVPVSSFHATNFNPYSLGKSNARLHQYNKPVEDYVEESGRNFVSEAEDGATICYDRYVARPKYGPPIFYLPCLHGPKNEAKASKLQAWCRKNGCTYLAADYYGVGRSSGEFTDGSVSRWAKDTIRIIEEGLLGEKGSKVVLVGHGVGAWVSFIVALQRPELVRGILGMAADPDFTEELLMKKLPEEIKKRIMEDGKADIKWGTEIYPISKTLIEDGRNNLLLQGGRGSVNVNCPVRLVHGLRDEEVSYEYAYKLADNIQSPDVKVILIKNSFHSMENSIDMRTMVDCVQDLCDTFVGEYDLTTPGSG